jgi:hypothetical protein
MKRFVKARAKRQVRRPESFRPRLETLENRLTPSGWQAIGAVAQPLAIATQVMPEVKLVSLMSDPSLLLTQSGGTYVTGSNRGASAEAVAVGADGSVYVTGFLKDTRVSPDQLLYVRKFGPTDSQSYFFDYLDILPAGNSCEGTGIAVDAAGNAYVSGTGYESGGAVGLALKFGPTGTNLVYGFYLSGSAGFDVANGFAIDTAGDATYALVDSPSPGVYDVAAVRLRPTGTFVFGNDYTLDGFSASGGYAVAMPPSGTSSIIGGYAIPIGGITPEFLLLTVDATGTQTAAYINPSTTTDVIYAVAVNSNGNIFVAGTVDLGGPTQTAVVEELDPMLTTVLWSTALPGSAYGYGIALDAAGDVISSGADSSGQAFIAKLTGTDGTLTDYIVFGGSGGSDIGRAVAVRPSDGHVFDVGITNSPDFPVTDGSTLNGTTDGFMTEWTFP